VVEARLRTARAAGLAGVLAVAGLAACGGDDAPVTAATAPAGQATPRRGTCVTVEHRGLRLGVTVPAGFAASSSPAGAAELAESDRVNLLTTARRTEPGRDLPTVVLAVFGYGPGEREGRDALEASVLSFKRMVGGTSEDDPVVAEPARVAGVSGTAGGGQDDEALDYTHPDAVPSPLRWWTVPAGGGEFVVALGSSTVTLDQQYARQVAKGLRTGGCPG
jgi:hypothetical protein